MITSDRSKLPEVTQGTQPQHDQFAESLRGFGLTGILAILAIINNWCIILPGDEIMSSQIF